MQLFQDGKIYEVDEQLLRVWLAEGRIKANAQLNLGNGWVPIESFPDCRQFLRSADPAPPPTNWAGLAAGAATIVGGALLLGALLDSKKSTPTRSSGPPRRSLFLSFDYDDKEQVDGFRLLAYNKYVDLDFRDGSLRRAINSKNDAYVEQRIREQMVGTSVCVCLIGNATYKSPWVNWEVETCAEEGKGLLGIHLKGKHGRVPDALVEYDATVIGWEPHTFAEAIEVAAQEAGR